MGEAFAYSGPKQQGVDDSEACLELFRRNGTVFSRRYVAMDFDPLFQNQIGTQLNGKQPANLA